MDFIRDLLLEIEGGRGSFSILTKGRANALRLSADGALSREAADRLEYHLELLEENGLVQFNSKSGGEYFVKRITWKGHDFLDSMRDSEVWSVAKKGANAAGGATVDMLMAVAKGFLKKKIEDHIGFPISL